VAPRLDAFDLALLDLMQRDNQLTSEQLAQAVALSPASCLRRVRRLREAGVISADVSLVDPALVGHRLSSLVLVSMEREDPQRLAAFRESIAAYPEVTQCYYVTGEADFVLMVTVADMSEYERFVARVLTADANVRTFQSLMVMSKVKFETRVPLPAVPD